MEAGRAIQRGLVSPGRTTLIASSHRAYAVSEKISPSDGAGDSGRGLCRGPHLGQALRRLSTWRRRSPDEVQSHISAFAAGRILAGVRCVAVPRAGFYEDTDPQPAAVGVEGKPCAPLRAPTTRRSKTSRRAWRPKPPRRATGRSEGLSPNCSRRSVMPLSDALVAGAVARFPKAAHPMIAARAWPAWSISRMWPMARSISTLSRHSCRSEPTRSLSRRPRTSRAHSGLR